MKFKIAVITSVVFHISLFALAIYFPRSNFRNETVYYVDLINVGGGGGGFKGNVKAKKSKASTKKSGTSMVVEKSARVKDLTVKKEVESKLRYPDKKVKKSKLNKKKEKEKKEIISVVRKDKKRNLSEENVSISKDAESNILKTGVSSGSGIGSGIGPGSGSGSGIGGGGKSSPYAYYYDRLIRKISSSWYSSLVSPGLRGKFVTTVYFKIFRNGQIKDIKLEKKSGIDSLDLSALRAVENAAPFAPLPYDFPYQYIIVHFDFTWEK